MIPNRLLKSPSNAGEAIRFQQELASYVCCVNKLGEIRYIAGVDISIRKSEDLGCAAIVLFQFPEMTLVESQTFIDKIPFPYIPGLLSYREIPLIQKAFSKLSIKPDLIMVDGQGIAHPRRIGFASHFGLITNIPSIGCAKSRLCGQYEMPAINKGAHTDLVDRNEIIGAVVRTKDNTKPMFISIGHNINLNSAIDWVLKCCHGYRLPEPCRLAHLTSKSYSR